MAVLATDDFNRANGGDLGTTWDVQTSAPDPLGIISNTAVPTGTSDGAENWNALTWPDNQYSQAVITAAGTYTDGDGPGLGIRMSSSANTYYRCVVNRNATNTVNISKKVAGAYTSLGFRNATYSAGAVLYFEAQGSTLICKYSGSQLGASISDSAITSGRAGLAYSGEGSTQAATWDTWEGGDFSGAATTAPPPWPPAYRIQPILGR
jgi:hypothetical protein